MSKKILREKDILILNPGTSELFEWSELEGPYKNGPFLQYNLPESPVMIEILDILDEAEILAVRYKSKTLIQRIKKVSKKIFQD